MKIRILISLFTLILLASCSGFSKSDCLAADWEQVGYEDGEAGKSASNAEIYQETCSSHQVTVDMNAYQMGHEEGVRVFCQPENGFEMGKQAYEYTVICPSDLRGPFRAEYSIGLEFYYVYQELHQLEMQLNNNTSTITKLEGGISTGYIRMDEPGLTVTERNQIRLNIESMERQIQDYELAIQRLEPAISEKMSQLRSLRDLYNR